MAHNLSSKATRTFYGMSFDESQVGGNDPPMVDGVVNATGDNFVSDLSTFKTNGARVIIKPVGGPAGYQNADLSFNLVLWKAKMDQAATRIGTQQMGNFVQDGTVMGNLLIDDAKEGSLVFGGSPPTTAQFDEMAEYSKSKWSTCPTLIRVDNEYLRSRASTFTHLDYTWNQVEARHLPGAAFLTTCINDGRALTLGTLFGFNLLNGGSGITAPWNVHPNRADKFGMSPQELDVISNTLSAQTFAIGVVGWSARPNFDDIDYYSMPSIQTALQYMASQAIGRTAGPINWREHSPSGSTNTGSGGSVSGKWVFLGSSRIRSNNPTTHTVPLPAGIPANSVIGIVTYSWDSGRSSVVPSGWSIARHQSDTSARGGDLAMYYKIADGSEGGTSVGVSYVGSVTDTACQTISFAFSGNTTGQPTVLANTGSVGTWGSKSDMGPVPGIQSAISDALIIIVAAKENDFNNGDPVAPGTMSATTADTEIWNRMMQSTNLSGPDSAVLIDYCSTTSRPSISTKAWTSQTVSAGSGCGFMVAFAPLSIISGTPPAFITPLEDVTISLGSSLSFTITSTGSTPITYSKESGPSNVTLGASTGAFQFTPLTGGAHVIHLAATNSFGSDNETFTVTVSSPGGSGSTETGANSAPSITHPGNMSVAAQQLLSFGLTATDADGDPLEYRLESGAPSGAFMDSNTGQFVWIPSGDQGPGTYPIVALVSDGQIESRSTFTVTVADAIWTKYRGSGGGFSQADAIGNQFRRI